MPYELQVDFESEKFAIFAICSHIPNESPVFLKDPESKSPFDPYFELPIFGAEQ